MKVAMSEIAVRRVVDALQKIREPEYPHTIIVKRQDGVIQASPENLTAYVATTGIPTAERPSHGQTEWTHDLVVSVFAVPIDNEPVEMQLHQARASVIQRMEEAWAADELDPVYELEWSDDAFFNVETAPFGVFIQLSVMYRHPYADPFLEV